MITSFSQLDLNKRYTYADYLTWEFKERVELLRGYVRKMSPAPNDAHQRVSGYLHGTIWAFLRGQSCEVRHAPYDVRLVIPSATPISDKRRAASTAISDDDIQTVVQPDLLVVCDVGKIDERGCFGPPDLVVEILSAGNNRADLVEKFAIYETAGVAEYWIVHPFEQTIIVYRLNEAGTYIGAKPLAPGELLSTPLLPGLEIPVEEVFV